MVFSTNARSFTNVPASNFSDANKNGTATSLTAPWGGEKNIWSFNSFSNRENKSDAAKLREYGGQGIARQPVADKKSGSRMLLAGSQAEIWGARPDPPNRSFTMPRQVETNGTQARHVSSAVPPQTCLSPTENISPTTTRPPIINLTSSDFTARMGRNGFTSHDSNPPTLYTKFNSNAAPMPIDSPRDSITSMETRKDIWSPASRDPSHPPSRHSYHEISAPEQPPSAGRAQTVATRTQSIPSQRNTSYSNFQPAMDQMLPQFGQMSLGQNGHAAALRKASEPWNGQYGQRAAHTSSRFNSLPANDRADIEENDPLGVSYVASDDYGYEQPVDYSRFPNARSGQASSQLEFRPAQPYTTGGASPRSLEFTNGMKAQGDWSSYTEELALNRGFNGVSEQQQAMLDPRLQQVLAMRTNYPAAMFNPYAMQNVMQPNESPQYYQMPMYPMAIAGLDNSMPPRETLISEGIQSVKLNDFKNAGKNNKRWELSDIFDHIAEFAGDQYGSRFIQTKLETANSDEKDRVFREIEPNSIPLMQDVFGNYVIQKFFDHGHQEHKKQFANKMRGNVLNLSLQMYGCRVVQKALEHILVEQQAALVGELENHVLKCVKDQNGNHVIQKAIERCAPETIGFIYSAFLDQVSSLSHHPYGCRVIQRCLERPEWFPSKPRILGELHESMQQGMISDQYGNYVVQHVVQKGGPGDKAQVFRIVIVALERYSKHKFASNVVEKCIEYSDDAWRRDVVNVLTAPDQRRSEGDTTLVSMIKDNFGNYVIQKLLDKLAYQDYHYFTNHLQAAIAQAKRHGCGKQIAAIESRMRRFGLPSHQQQQHQQHQQQSFSLAIPTMPYASHYASVANTPPPLTADTQSLQSSAIPSINGDAVEGAQSVSRKGSDPPGGVGLLR